MHSIVYEQKIIAYTCVVARSNVVKDEAKKVDRLLGCSVPRRPGILAFWHLSILVF